MLEIGEFLRKTFKSKIGSGCNSLDKSNSPSPGLECDCSVRPQSSDLYDKRLCGKGGRYQVDGITSPPTKCRKDRPEILRFAVYRKTLGVINQDLEEKFNVKDIFTVIFFKYLSPLPLGLPFTFRKDTNILGVRL